MDEGEEVDAQLLEPARDPPTFLEPADTPLNNIPLPIGLTIKRSLRLSGRHRLIRSQRDHRLHPVLSDPSADVRVAEPPVAGDRPRPRSTLTAPTTDLDQFHRRLKVLRLMVLAGGDPGHDGHAVAVGEEMDLRAESPATAA